MKDKKYIQSFNEHQENLNISDVSNDKKIVKKIWDLVGRDDEIKNATGNEIRLPYKNEVPFYNRKKVEKLLKILYNGQLPEWW